MFTASVVIAKGFGGEGLRPSPAQAGRTNGSVERGGESRGSSAHEFASKGGAPEEVRTGPVQTGEVGVTRELATDPSSETATAFPLACLLDLRRDTTVT